MALDALQSITQDDQTELERRVLLGIYAKEYPDGRFDPEDEEGLALNRQQHAKYLYGGLGQLPAGFISLDASRTWICYWITHSLVLLEAPLPQSPSRESIIAFLASCQHPDGGFGGGPYQLAHLAPTFAAVGALVTLGGADALQVVDRPKLHAFLFRMCVPPELGGGMTMHEGGEVDVRGCYCALAACEMLGLDKAAVAGACGMVDYIRRCQSHEGGIGGEPWNEAHGGYTFCGLAAACLLGRAAELDLPRLLRWAVRCQGAAEGGFMGRTNKLVDGCYSFWQGGALPLLAAALAQQAQAGLSTPQGSGQQAGGAAPGASGNEDAAEGGVAAARILEQLALEDGDEAASQAASEAASQEGAGSASSDGIGGVSLREWVARLPHLTPAQAAARRAAQLQAELDAAVEASLEAEERWKAAAGRAAGGPLQQQALAALERAAELQQALKACQAAAATAVGGAAALLDAATGGGVEAGGGERLPQLYDAAALQLWLLKCCQAAPRGGMRDKPGKPPDYYHTCYCLSGLSSSQHYSGVVLGGQQNLLARADPLCNVVASRLQEARAFFGRLDGDGQQAAAAAKP